MTTLHLYRAALICSLLLNVLLGAGIALYIHYAGLLDVVAEAVGLFD